MAIISGDLVHALDLLPINELYEVECYIRELKNKRKEELEKEYLDKLKILLNEAHERDIHFLFYNENMQHYFTLYSEDISIE